MENLDGNVAALNTYMAKIQSGEEQLEEAQELIDTRLSDIIEEELFPLLQEVNGLDYGVNAKELIMEHIEAML